MRRTLRRVLADFESDALLSPAWTSDMTLIRPLVLLIFFLLALMALPRAARAATPPATPVPAGAYVLGDSIANGLQLAGLEAQLQDRLGGPVRISFDGGRSISTPGNQIKKTALESVDADKDHIAKSGVIIIVLGMNMNEKSFSESQQALMTKMKAIAPKARYFWVDVGATVSTHAALWSARNKTIYDNADKLGYQVVSRYRAIFGPAANPLDIKPGQNFPGWTSEGGLGGPGNVHGYDAALVEAILAALDGSPSAPLSPDKLPPRLNPAERPLRATCDKAPGWSSYLLGDSIIFGLHRDRLALKLTAMLGGPVRISYDSGRSITTPGNQIKKTALESVDLDQAFIANARIIVIALGTNQLETSFIDSQRLLMQKLKALAPQARYYWIDIGATISTQTAGWSARNKVIYENAPLLGYTVISRYKTVFGPEADPLNITPGLVFPGMESEAGYSGPGNVHGAYPELTEALLDVLSGVPPYAPRGPNRPAPANCPAGQ
jgi:hypothetical protein